VLLLFDLCIEKLDLILFALIRGPQLGSEFFNFFLMFCGRLSYSFKMLLFLPVVLVSEGLPVVAYLLLHCVELAVQITDYLRSRLHVLLQFLLVFSLCLSKIKLKFGLELSKLLITHG